MTYTHKSLFFLTSLFSITVLIFSSVRPELIEGQIKKNQNIDQNNVPQSTRDERGNILNSSVLANVIPNTQNDQDGVLTFAIAAKENAKVKLFIGSVNPHKWHGDELVAILKHDFSFSEQFDVTLGTYDHTPGKTEMKKLFAEGYLLALFINAKSSNQLEWRIYDTMQGNMVNGKIYTVRGTALRGWAHNIADAVWPQLTGQEGFFSTKIAYCKDVKGKAGKKVKNICIADFDGTQEQLLVNVPTITVAPRWNHDVNNPLLFYSEFTNSNVRLMTVDMHKTRRIASNFEGINMVPAFSGDGTKGVYCASRCDGTCQLYYFEKSIFKKITHNGGANVSPTMSSDGNEIYFCSDFETGHPQIYKLAVRTKKIDRLTHEGYCATPALNEKHHSLAYTKKVGAEMQVFMLDLNTMAHTQLTHDKGSKQECSWSPCGNYLLYSLDQRNASRIVMYNMLSGTKKFLTDASVVASYPSWSPVYNQLPVIS